MQPTQGDLKGIGTFFDWKPSHGIDQCQLNILVCFPADTCPSTGLRSQRIGGQIIIISIKKPVEDIQVATSDH